MRSRLTARARSALGSLIPRGRQLPMAAWASRHTGMTVLLWLHASGLMVLASLRGYPLNESFLAVSLLVLAAVLGSVKRLGRRARSCLVSVGLLSSSAVLVYLTGGLAESNFHFFVMLAVITLYQDWVPFLVAVGFAALHRAVFGVFLPGFVFNSPEAQRRPVLWAAIHATYVLAAAAANLYTWRLSEDERARTDAAKSAEEEVRIARDDAVEVSRLKSQFLATMSHEIRTPMNGVIGLTGLLLNTGLDDTQRRYAEGVQAAGDGLLTVINDILDYSKLEAGKVEIESIELDTGRLLEDVAGLLAPPALSRGLELIAYCHLDVPAGLRGDTGRIRQVLINLVSNAVKFTHSGEVVVRAQLVKENPDNAVVRFEVADTGIGIAPEDRARLFEPFAQADATTTRRYGGTGLGLAICVRLVAVMGGTLELDSTPGQGSTFSFVLTLDKGPVSESTGDSVADSALTDLRVLVVDDNATNRWILSAQLQGWQMTADLAEDGASALIAMRAAVAAGRPYALAILDMHMPEMDGVELARAISGDPALAVTKLMLLTSGGDLDAKTAVEVGLVARLTKPVRQAALKEQLLRLIAPATPPAASYRIPAPRAATEPLRGHLLVVEDNELNQLVARGLLVALGFSCDMVGDGEQALAALSSAPAAYAAVLMDCHMPEMDGFEATEEIRRREGSGRHTPIIAMTASALAEDRDRCIAAGMDDFVTKPVDPQALDNALSRWLSTPEPVSPAAPPAQPLAAALLPPPATDALDTARIEVLRRLGPADGTGLLPRFVQAFTDDVPTRLSAVEQAVATSDAPALSQAAHLLRGAAANVGALAVAGLCGELEAIGRLGGTADPELVERLANELARATGALAAALPAATVPEAVTP